MKTATAVASGLYGVRQVPVELVPCPTIQVVGCRQPLQKRRNGVGLYGNVIVYSYI